MVTRNIIRNMIRNLTTNLTTNICKNLQFFAVFFILQLRRTGKKKTPKPWNTNGFKGFSLGDPPEIRTPDTLLKRQIKSQ